MNVNPTAHSCLSVIVASNPGLPHTCEKQKKTTATNKMWERNLLQKHSTYYHRGNPSDCLCRYCAITGRCVCIIMCLTQPDTWLCYNSGQKKTVLGMHAYVLCQLVSEMPTDTLSVLMAGQSCSWPYFSITIFFSVASPRWNKNASQFRKFNGSEMRRSTFLMFRKKHLCVIVATKSAFTCVQEASYSVCSRGPNKVYWACYYMFVPTTCIDNKTNIIVPASL